MAFDKCSSGGSKDQSALKGEANASPAYTAGNPALACPYEVERTDNTVGPQTFWIISETAESPEQRAATVFVAAGELLAKAKLSGNVDIVLAIAPNLVGRIPNALHGLYMARATRTNSNASGWKVTVSKEPRTPQAIETLRAIYNAKNSKLQTEQDYARFLMEKHGMASDEAERRVVQAINLGTPSTNVDFGAVASAAASSPTFDRVLTGKDGVLFGETPVNKLADMIEAIYRGQVSIDTASRYAFSKSALENVFLHSIVGEFIIYHARGETGAVHEFALPRDAAFEAAKGDSKEALERYYRDLIGKSVEFDSANPINTGEGVQIVGEEQFSTEAGLVKRVPVVSLPILR
jgi:hypothetical protein